MIKYVCLLILLGMVSCTNSRSETGSFRYISGTDIVYETDFGEYCALIGEASLPDGNVYRYPMVIYSAKYSNSREITFGLRGREGDYFVHVGDITIGAKEGSIILYNPESSTFKILKDKTWQGPLVNGKERDVPKITAIVSAAVERDTHFLEGA